MKNVFISAVALILLISLSGNEQSYAGEEIYLIEEEAAFWKEIIKDESIKDRNLFYASYVAYKNRLNDLLIQTFNECMKKNLSNELVSGISLYYIGKSYFREGRFDEAVSKFDQVFNYDLKEYNYIKFAVRINKAIAYYRLNRSDMFKEILEGVIDEDHLGKYRRIALILLLKAKETKTVKIDKTRESQFKKEKDIEVKQEKKTGIKTEKENITEHQFAMLKTLSSAVLVLEVGKNFFISELGKNYINPVYVRPSIYFYISNFIGISLNAEYFKAQSTEQSASNNSVLEMLGATVDLQLYLRFAQYLVFYISPGIGAAQTTITYQPSNFVSKTTDPYLVSSAAMCLEMGHVQIKIGTSYKRVFIYNNAENKYVGNDLVSYSIFGGIGYKF